MAKKRTEKPVVPTASSKGPKPNGLVVRTSSEWREWLKRAADHERTTVADFLDRAAADRAHRNGFQEEPPKR